MFHVIVSYMLEIFISFVSLLPYHNLALFSQGNDTSLFLMELDVVWVVTEKL